MQLLPVFAFAIAAIACASAPAAASVVYTVEYLVGPDGGSCGPLINANTPWSSALPPVTITVKVSPGDPCFSFFPTQQRLAPCMPTGGGGPTPVGRQWCVPGNEMPRSSNGYYGWVDTGAIPTSWLNAPFNEYILHYQNTTTTCPVPAAAGNRIIVSEMYFVGVTLSDSAPALPDGSPAPLGRHGLPLEQRGRHGHDHLPRAQPQAVPDDGGDVVHERQRLPREDQGGDVRQAG
ncbi:hypothetical protein DFJ74DRAFT_344119 [Hyaloraphidium curvatum]|nr:hypothetical protein DFJ74DRAFT_344119 [Hyaloraphidium curvatum]